MSDNRLRQADLAQRLLDSARATFGPPPIFDTLDEAAEGGCGVIGVTSSVQIPGRTLLAALQQMQNRGNGKGGGLAAVGLDETFFGVSREVMRDDYLLAIAYMDTSCREDLEAKFIQPTFEIDATFEMPTIDDPAELGLQVRPPDVTCYFVRVKPAVRDAWMREVGIEDPAAAEDEIVYRNSYALNVEFYSSVGDKRAFVLSNGRNLIVLKLVGYGDDSVRYYKFEDARAHVWIGHHRYPTKGTVWHPGGAHPFSGMHEALVHNGDFANYASISTYLAQQGRYPLFLTDTEVAVLVYDLLSRTYGYPLEYVIEALAPTTERDFSKLPSAKQSVYKAIQATHLHGSPDGPWFFLIAQSSKPDEAYRLIGITDTSMLRPQVFALQQGPATIAFAASEKQAIDAALDSLAAEDDRFWPRADRYWNARGGSHTDGGAFVFTAQPEDHPGERLPFLTDKFGNVVDVDSDKIAPVGDAFSERRDAKVAALAGGDAETVFAAVTAAITGWGYGDVADLAMALANSAETDTARDRAFAAFNLLLDRRYPTGNLKRSGVLSVLDVGLDALVDQVRRHPTDRYIFVGADHQPLRTINPDTNLIIDATGYDIEGNRALSRELNNLIGAGWRRFIIMWTRGHRFIGCGLGAGSEHIRVDVYGSPGDYLGSGIDGARIEVHGNGQDQMAQITKSGTLVVHGDVGQTFGYAMKGGSVFILGNAAGRPLINAVGKPRVVINGTCLDYLAESFMAGDPLENGGFAVLNGLAFTEAGELVDLDEPYPGGNLFSLASGGAIYVRDPRRVVGSDQLNAGEFVPLLQRDWDEVLAPILEENEAIFGITIDRLLTSRGEMLSPDRVYRKIQPTKHGALTPEEAWVRPDE